MSHDIWIRSGASTGDDSLAPLGSRAEILAALARAWPTLAWENEQWGVVEGKDYSVEVNVGDEEPVTMLALHVRGSGLDWWDGLADLCQETRWIAEDDEGPIDLSEDGDNDEGGDEDDGGGRLDLASAGKRLFAFQGELDAGHFGRVRSDAREIAESCPPFAPIARVLEASAAWGLGALDEAAALLTPIADSASTPRDLARSASLMLATLDLELGRVEAATARSRAVRAGAEALPPALALLGALSEARATAMAGDIAAARERLETIRVDVEAQRDPRTRRAALMGLALAWQACGDLPRARDVFAQRLAEGADAGALPEVLVLLARCEAALGHGDEARSLLTRAADSGLESRYVAIARAELGALE